MKPQLNMKLSTEDGGYAVVRAADGISLKLKKDKASVGLRLTPEEASALGALLDTASDLADVDDSGDSGGGVFKHDGIECSSEIAKAAGPQALADSEPLSDEEVYRLLEGVRSANTGKNGG